MGWKNVKEHYRIVHYVQVTEKGICIGSGYIHDLIVIAPDGKLIKSDIGTVNEDLCRYKAEMEADPAKLRELIETPDTFTKCITVYTWEGPDILEKQCEKPGWPNVTHDGLMMYENTFSRDKAKVVGWAKRDAQCGIEWRQARMNDLRREASAMELELVKATETLAKLEKEGIRHKWLKS